MWSYNCISCTFQSICYWSPPSTVMHLFNAKNINTLQFHYASELRTITFFLFPRKVHCSSFTPSSTSILPWQGRTVGTWHQGVHNASLAPTLNPADWLGDFSKSLRFYCISNIFIFPWTRDLLFLWRFPILDGSVTLLKYCPRETGLSLREGSF